MIGVLLFLDTTITLASASKFPGSNHEGGGGGGGGGSPIPLSRIRPCLV